MKRVAVILAAGKGVRMKSDLPKVSHLVGGKPMIARVLGAISELGLDETFVIVGYKAELVRSECSEFRVKFIEQKEQLGTGHAVMQARAFIPNSVVLVLNGDVPLIKSGTLKKMMEYHASTMASATVLTAVVGDPHSYGRIVRAGDGSIERIVEQKDADANQLLIREVNTGTYCFNSNDLFRALDSVKPNNAQKEYYLTDVIGILKREGRPVHAYKAPVPEEVLGVNTAEELIKLEEAFKRML